MIANKPPNETSGSGKAARFESQCISIVSWDRLSVNHARTQWRNEARRLFAEYSRTSHGAHLKAFRVHRAAMGARLRGIKIAKWYRGGRR